MLSTDNVLPAERVKLSSTVIVVAFEELIVLPLIAIVPKVCVVPELENELPVIVPVVVKFSLPKEILPLESVIEPFVSVKFPASTVGVVNLVVTVTLAGNPIVNVSVALTTASISFEVPTTVNVSPPPTIC